MGQIISLSIQTSLSVIAETAIENQEENFRFVDFLKQRNSQAVDEEVQRLNQLIEPKIDCTSCGNCCKSLMINVTSAEADRVADRLQIKRGEFDDRYLEKGSHELMIINKIPCHFLADNKCTIYEDRFAGCREFPALHLPHFTGRLFSVMMHYDRCPIIFNVMEQLKTSTGFNTNVS